MEQADTDKGFKMKMYLLALFLFINFSLYSAYQPNVFNFAYFKSRDGELQHNVYSHGAYSPNKPHYLAVILSLTAANEIEYADEELSSIFSHFLAWLQAPEQIQIRNSVTSLNLNNCKITHLSECRTLFNIIPHITELSLLNNAIDSIDPLDWSSLTDLAELSLGCNNLTSLPGAAFSCLSQLKVLKLFKNKLSALASQALSNLNSLEELNLTDNPLDEDRVQLPFDLETRYATGNLKISGLSPTFLQKMPLRLHQSLDR